VKHIFFDTKNPAAFKHHHSWRLLVVATGVIGVLGVAGINVDSAKAQQAPILRQGISDPVISSSGVIASEAPTVDPEIFTTPLESGTPPVDLVSPTSRPTSIRELSNNNRRAISTLRQGGVGELDDNGLLDPRNNRPVTAVEGRGATASANPYAATGLRLGTFDLFPTLEQSIGYTSNADESQNGRSSTFSQTDFGLRLQSNWSIHQFQAELGATYQRFFNGTSTNLPAANAEGSLRLDVGREYAATFRGAYDLTTESASSANLVTGSAATIVDRPNVEILSASAELARIEGKLRFSLRGSLDKTLYEDASLSNGSNLFQGDRDNVLSGITTRFSYQISPAVTPFVEGRFSKRIYNIVVDRNGNRRDSNTYALRGGLELDFGEKLTGQVALGYAEEDFKDINIAALKGTTFDGAINWSPMRLTTITASGSTSLVSSTNANDNGSILYAGSVGISRQVRPQLTLDANLTASLQDYDTAGRRDVTLGANAGYTYWFNRFVAATGRVSYQTVDSNVAGSSYDVGSVIFGLRLQR